MSEYVKPPIGVSPHWYLNNNRIIELSEAITRYAKFIRDYSSIVDGRIYYDIIKKYGEEIKMLSQAEKKLLKMDKETKKNEAR